MIQNIKNSSTSYTNRNVAFKGRIPQEEMKKIEEIAKKNPILEDIFGFHHEKPIFHPINEDMSIAAKSHSKGYIVTIKNGLEEWFMAEIKPCLILSGQKVAQKGETYKGNDSTVQKFVSIKETTTRLVEALKQFSAESLSEK